MPSLQVGGQSGGVGIFSGNPFSGSASLAAAFPFPYGGISLKAASSGLGPVYVGLTPPPQFSGFTSGIGVTILSGGALTSGGLTDGLELSRGEVLYVPKARLTSGLASINFTTVAGASGTVVFWDFDTFWRN